MEPTPLVADSALVRRFVPSPNHDARRPGEAPSILLLHYTGMATADAAINRLADPAAKVSCHYVVDEDAGAVIQMVAENRRAWHAGIGSWRGERDVNATSIGIEIVNRGHEFDYPDFPGPQVATVIALCRDILARHDIPADNVLAHSDTAPARKRDPGEKFPWERLFRSGIGHWVAPAPIVGGPFLAPGDAGEAVAALQTMLAGYGYGLEATGAYDTPTEATVRAFQRHFRPALVDGVADASTINTLRELIAARPAVSPIS